MGFTLELFPGAWKPFTVERRAGREAAYKYKSE